MYMCGKSSLESIFIIILTFTPSESIALKLYEQKRTWHTMDEIHKFENRSAAGEITLSDRERQLEYFSEAVLETVLEILNSRQRKDRTPKGGGNQTS